MEVSRRDFLKVGGGVAGGTALGGARAASASTSRPTLARAQELRIKDAKATPSVCPYCAVGCATLVHTVDGQIVNIEGDPRSPHQRGHALPEGRGDLSSSTSIRTGRPRCCTARRARPSGRCGTWSARWTASPSWSKKTRDETFVERLPNGKVVNCTTGDLLARRRHARQRVEPHPAEADARPRHRRDREPGPDMTQLQRPRSGDAARARRRDDVPAQHGGLRLHRHHGLEHGREPPGRLPLADAGQAERAPSSSTSIRASPAPAPWRTSTRRSGPARTSPSSAASSTTSSTASAGTRIRSSGRGVVNYTNAATIIGDGVSGTPRTTTASSRA